MIQLRNVPDELHRKLKIRAIEANLTLSDYLIREVAAVAGRPTLEELLARIRARGSEDLPEDTVVAVRAERESRR
jgi:plasmid stability protein